MSEADQKSRDKTLNYAKKELKKLGKAGLAEIKRMEEEEKVMYYYDVVSFDAFVISK